MPRPPRLERLESRTLLAAGPVTPVPGDFSLYTTAALTTPGLTGSYVNQSLRARLAQDDWRTAVAIAGTRVDPAINFTANGWGARAPLNLTGGTDADWDNFSVQWDGYLKVDTPNLRFATRSDDSSRMWIDVNGDGAFATTGPELVDNGWGVGHPATTGPASQALPRGVYKVRIQYEEGTTNNVMQLIATPPAMVRVAYLIPSNRTAQPHGVETLQNFLRLMKSWYADQTDRYGFGGKTITYETESDGVTPKVWVLNATQDDAFMRADMWGNVNTAASGAGVPLFAQGQDWLIVTESHTVAADGTKAGGVALGASFGSGFDGGVAHIGSDALAVMRPEFLTDNRTYNGLVLPELSPNPMVFDKTFGAFEGNTLSALFSTYVGATIHELSHGLGMPHDFRGDANFHGNVMGNGLRGSRGAFLPDRYPNDDTYLAHGMALALSTSRYLNPTQASADTAKPSLSVTTTGATAPVGGRLPVAFTASDPSGLAVALLMRNGELVDEMILSGTSTSQTFSTPFYTPGASDKYLVAVYDVFGNRTDVENTITPGAAANRAPVPFLRLNNSQVTATRPFTLDASGTVDPDNTGALRYEWDLDGNGTFDTAPSSLATYTTSFATPGVRKVRVRVTDLAGSGASAVSAFIGVRVNPVPQVVASALLDDTSPNRLRVAFNKDVADTLAAADLHLTNLTTGQTVGATSFAYDPPTRTALFTFAGALADGRYRVTLLSTEVADLGAVPLDGDANGTPGGNYTFDFVHRAGDANHDGAVDFLDLVTLARNYNTAGTVFSQGDFDYDGDVDFADLVLLAQGYNTQLPNNAPTPFTAPPQQSLASSRIRPRVRLA